MTITATEGIDAPAQAGPQRRVLLFTDSDVFAGTERHILELAKELRHCGAAVSIACPKPSVLQDLADAEHLSVVVIQKGGLLDRPAINTLTKLLQTGEIDLIHAHNGRTGLSAALAARRAGSGASVVTQHFIEPGRLLQSALKRTLGALAHRWTNARITRFIAISQAVQAAMLARRDAPPQKIAIVPNGISAPDNGPARDASRIRTEFAVRTETPLIVCVARLEKEKDVPTLISAMKTVISTNPTARCLIVGEGSGRVALELQVASSGLERNITLTGFRRDSLAFIAAADVFVLPSLAEPFGLVILEAMALGKPVIASDAGGPREIVVHGDTGLLVPPARPDAMAAALRQLVDDPSARARMGAEGRRRFASKYTARAMARSTLAVYEDALRSAVSAAR